MEADDYELLRRWRNGDAEAGDRLVRRHIKGVYRFLAARGGDRVEDAVQRTFEMCLKKADQFRGDGSFRAYLFRIARNQMLNAQRDWSRDASAKAASDGSDLQAEMATPTGMVAEKERAKILMRAVAALPGNLRSTVELFYWGDLATKEIAEILGIAKSTATSRLFRAHELLREQITTMDLNAAVRATTLTYIEQVMNRQADEGEGP